MNDRPLRIGTRGSPLALAQALMVRDLHAAAFPDAPPAEVVEIRTTGDAVTDRPLSEVGGK
ncbi:MAG: hydroxymethylbilane synthase, partial [Alphaproteobacteria bacterium]|nr:hydroxymethylbilane synthase [Alphaproteobacteria bacterium]